MFRNHFLTDQEKGKKFPNAKTVTVFRDDVSNKGILKNPYNKLNDPIDQKGVRPWRITNEAMGNVFAKTATKSIPNVTNMTMLQNPYNTLSEPAPEKRILSRQLIKDINSKVYPSFITQNKGIGEIPYTILKYLRNNGVKLISLAIISSYISGKPLTSFFDKGGHYIARAISFFKQLVDDATSLHRQGMLIAKIQELLNNYTIQLQRTFGDVVLQDVAESVIQNETQKIAYMSGVVSRLFNQQNTVEPSNLVSYQELIGTATPFNQPQYMDNLPNPPQEIKDHDEVPDPNIQHPHAPIVVNPQESRPQQVIIQNEQPSATRIIGQALIAGATNAIIMKGIDMALRYNGLGLGGAVPPAGIVPVVAPAGAPLPPVGDVAGIPVQPATSVVPVLDIGGAAGEPEQGVWTPSESGIIPAKIFNDMMNHIIDKFLKGVGSATPVRFDNVDNLVEGILTEYIDVYSNIFKKWPLPTQLPSQRALYSLLSERSSFSEPAELERLMLRIRNARTEFVKKTFNITPRERYDRPKQKGSGRTQKGRKSNTKDNIDEQILKLLKR